MEIVMGPVLGFRSTKDGTWDVSVLIVLPSSKAATPLHLDVEGGGTNSVQPTKLGQNRKRTVWQYDLSTERGSDPRTATYDFGADSDMGQRWTFIVPPAGFSPRMAYASCNGYSHPKYMKQVEKKNILWEQMGEKHEEEPFHLLLLGGDQVYGDSIWEVVPDIKKWNEKNRDAQLKTKFSNRMSAKVEDFYFDLYCSRWSQKEPAAMLAQIPSIMMWDDHDIFDGWGSHGKALQNCPVFRGIFKYAWNHFRMFQQHESADEKSISDPNDPSDSFFASPPSLNKYFEVGNIAIAALDMRSQRTDDRVLDEDDWKNFLAWMDEQSEIEHLLVMSSIPVVHPDFSLIESLFRLLPGKQELEDDLRDHWHSRPHKNERLRLIHRLFKFASEKNARVTLLSGDVHVAALGVIENKRDAQTSEQSRSTVINQLTSSAIVHPPPPGMMLYFLDKIGDKTDHVDQGITARQLEFPGTRNYFLGGRNWMSLDFDKDSRIWANWHIEGETHPYTKVVHPAA